MYGLNVANTMTNTKRKRNSKRNQFS